MREIKFRAWDEYEKNYYIVGRIDWLTGIIDVVLRDRAVAWTNDKIEKYVLEQFTGLHDKNGKEIYEGDIVRITHSNGEYFDAVVMWFQHNDHSSDGEYEMEVVQWVLKKYMEQGKECADAVYHLFCQEVREVIGNIHENKEIKI